MGSFINSQSDNEICEVLNQRFSDDKMPGDTRTYIGALREQFQNREKFFDANHHLNRVFHRFARSVTSGSVPKTKKSRLRWFALLRVGLPAAVRQAIKDQLTKILKAPTADNPAASVIYVTFSTQHVPTASGTFELFDRNGSDPQVLTDANGKTYCAIVLQCHVDAGIPDAPTEADPPVADPGETTFARRRVVKKAKKLTKKSTARKKKASPKGRR